MSQKHSYILATFISHRYPKIRLETIRLALRLCQLTDVIDVLARCDRVQWTCAHANNDWRPYT